MLKKQDHKSKNMTKIVYRTFLLLFVQIKIIYIVVYVFVCGVIFSMVRVGVENVDISGHYRSPTGHGPAIGRKMLQKYNVAILCRSSSGSTVSLTLDIIDSASELRILTN